MLSVSSNTIFRIAIYFIATPDRSRIKIGTTNQLTTRIKALRLEHGDLVVLAVLDGSYDVEKGLHRRFSHLNVTNEWFKPGDDLLGFIAAEGRSWNPKEDPDERTYVSVKMDADVLQEARIAATLLKMSLTDYLSEIVGRAATVDVEEGFARRMEAKAKP